MMLLSTCYCCNKFRSPLLSWPHISCTSGLSIHTSSALRRQQVCWLQSSSRQLSYLTPSFLISALVPLIAVSFFLPTLARVKAEVPELCLSLFRPLQWLFGIFMMETWTPDWGIVYLVWLRFSLRMFFSPLLTY